MYRELSNILKNKQEHFDLNYLYESKFSQLFMEHKKQNTDYERFNIYNESISTGKQSNQQNKKTNTNGQNHISKESNKYSYVKFLA